MNPTTTTGAMGQDVSEHLVDAGEVAVDALAGAAAGAAVGAIAGPPGAIAGAVLGAMAGAAAAVALHIGQLERDRHDEQLDRDMGVLGGSIGEAPPDAPRSERGRFHLETLGIGEAGGSAEPAEGMIQSVGEG
jgi:hypothetical protein